MRLETCPSCDSSDLHIYSSEASEFRTRVGGEEFIQPSYRVLRCRECDLYFKSSVLEPEELARYYKLVDFGKWCSLERSPIEEGCANVLADVPPGGAILDYGCSTGQLLSSYVSVHRCYGLEVNARAADEASRRGIRMVDEAELSALEPLDAVVLSDVYEHLLRPAATALRLLGLVKPGGALVIATGYARSWVFRVQREAFWYFRTPEHVSMVTPHHLAYVARKGGGRLACWTTSSHYRFGWTARARQGAELALHACLNGRWERWTRPVAGWLPGIRRALRWHEAPVVSGFRDHILATIRTSAKQEIG
jgi:SAM-dependent methyltransferase